MNFCNRGNVDKWTPVFDDVNHRADWMQIGNANGHHYSKESLWENLVVIQIER